MNSSDNRRGRRPPPPRFPSANRASTPNRNLRPTARADANPLDPALKRRLYWIGALSALVIFGVGLGVFAILLGFDNRTGGDASPGDTGDPGTALSQADSPSGEAVALRRGGELTQAVLNNGNGGQLSFNPLFATGEAAQTAVDLLFPRLLGQDPTTGLMVPTELAERWEIDDSGRRYTFFLRDSIFWRDGTPVTAQDFIFTYTALARPETASPFASRAQLIESLAAPDPYTLVVTLHAPGCPAIHSFNRPLLPHHRYAPDFSDLASNPLNLEPAVTAGPFQFESYTPGQRIVLARNSDFWKGEPRLDRYVLAVVSTADEQRGLLEQGAVDLARLPVGQIQQIAADAPFQVHRLPQAGFTFVAANLADPGAPQPGRNENGERQPQAPHPILGDPAVRQALALAIDGDALARAFSGNGGDLSGSAAGGYALGGYLLPSIAWANPSPPPPLPFDASEAGARLDAAGWPIGEDGIRQREGTPLALRLMTNADNPVRVAMAQTIEQNLGAIGVQVRLEILPFETMAAQLIEQQFDLTVGGWDNLAPDPGLHPFWHSRDDIPGTGFNFTSFQDAQVDAWLDEAQVLPGCAPDARGARYAQAQAQIQGQTPYLAIVGAWDGWGHAAGLHNVEPGPWQIHQNVYNWGWSSHSE